MRTTNTVFYTVLSGILMIGLTYILKFQEKYENLEKKSIFLTQQTLKTSEQDWKDCQNLLIQDKVQQRRNGCYEVVNSICAEKAYDYEVCKKELLKYCEEMGNE